MKMLSRLLIFINLFFSIALLVVIFKAIYLTNDAIRLNEKCIDKTRLLNERFSESQDLKIAQKNSSFFIQNMSYNNEFLEKVKTLLRSLVIILTGITLANLSVCLILIRRMRPSASS
jgi:hypothetical protein